MICFVVRKINNYFKYHFNKRSIFQNKETGEKLYCKVSEANDVEWNGEYKIVKRYASKSEWHNLKPFADDFLQKVKINCDNCKYDRDCDGDYPEKVKCKHDSCGRVIEFDKFVKK